MGGRNGLEVGKGGAPRQGSEWWSDGKIGKQWRSRDVICFLDETSLISQQECEHHSQPAGMWRGPVSGHHPESACDVTGTQCSRKAVPSLTSDQIRSVAQSCPTLCDPMNCSTPGLPVHHQLPEFSETHVHRVSDAIQPSHPLLSSSPLAPNFSQHQSLFQWVNSSHEVAKVLEFQLYPSHQTHLKFTTLGRDTP